VVRRGGKCADCGQHGAVEDRETGAWYCWSDARKRGMLASKPKDGHAVLIVGHRKDRKPIVIDPDAAS
jgi:hypothetical protein